jgi:hypothetical protein
MAIVENRATANGDILVIKTDVPIVGIVALTSFIDTTTGETSSTYFQKTFRYSTNGGLTYSSWLALTTVNVQNIVIVQIDYFIVEYHYTRIGTGGDISFIDAHLGGTLIPLTSPIYNDTIFSDLFDPYDPNVLGWALNVLEKLFKRGIIPAYLPRNNEIKDDHDFISYWFTVTHFFAILVYYSRSFENITADVAFMREFVKGRGVYMTNNPDLDELYYIYSNYISEIQKRGTKQIMRRTMTSFNINAVESDIPIDGELLRILNTALLDEFIFGYTLRGDLGWCIGQSSPLYTGADNIVNLIKGYESTSEVYDLTKYPLLNPSYISLVDDMICIDGVLNAEQAGIGVTAFDVTKAILVDPTLDYEISFRCAKTIAGYYVINFGVRLFDQYGVEVSPVKITDETLHTYFLEYGNMPAATTNYWVRALLHPYTAALLPDDVLTFGAGQGLRMPSTAKYMIPTIMIYNNDGSTMPFPVYIWDIKIRPGSLWFSRGTLSARNFILGWLKNNSAEYNETQIEKIINEKLIPYNTFSLLNFI